MVKVFIHLALALTLAAQIGAVHAHVTPGGENDAVKGGGWIRTPFGGKGKFGVAAGCKKGAIKGHMKFKDDALNLKVKGEKVTAVTATSDNTRVIEGTGKFDGPPGFESENGSFRATVTDNGKKGRGDEFSLELSTGYFAQGVLEGGDLQIHRHAGSSECPASEPPGDDTPPTVTVTSPASGSTVSGTVTVSADAADDAGVAGVQFLVDGAVIGAEDTRAPFSVSWDTTRVADGSHSLTAIARDEAGNSTTSSPVGVTVANGAPSDTTPPTVAITSPAAGSTVSATVTVSADASDNAGVAGVRFFVDGAAIGAEDTSSPFSVSWDTTSVADGSHSLTAVARDPSGNSATSAAVTVTVTNDGGGGTAIRVEENDASVAYAGAWVSRGSEVASFSGGSAASSDQAGAGASLTFSGTGVSWIGLKCNVCGIAEVSIDGGPATSVDTGGPDAPGSAGLASEAVFSSPALAGGTHTISITVTGTSTSGGNHIIVDAFDVISGGGSGGGDTTPPSVSLTSPADGATVSGTVTVSADASDNTGVAGVQFFVDGAAVGAEDLTAPYSVSWDTSAAANGSHSLTAVARDGTGNTATSAAVSVTVDNGGGGGGTTTRREETDASIAYTPNWFERFDPSFSGGQLLATPNAGEQATLTFNGTAVTWIGATCNHCGIARVFLDGTLVAEVDAYAPGAITGNVPQYSAAGLSPGTHSLTIEVSGAFNPSSTGAWIGVDAFDVTQ